MTPIEANSIQVRRRDHAIARALERCDVPMSIPEYEVLNLKIVNDRARFLWRQSLTRTHWLVYHQDCEALHAVYHRDFHQIITFLSDGEHLHRLTVVNPDALVEAVQAGRECQEALVRILNGRGVPREIQGSR